MVFHIKKLLSTEQWAFDAFLFLYTQRIDDDDDDATVPFPHTICVVHGYVILPLGKGLNENLKLYLSVCWRDMYIVLRLIMYIMSRYI